MYSGGPYNKVHIHKNVYHEPPELLRTIFGPRGGVVSLTYATHRTQEAPFNGFFMKGDSHVPIPVLTRISSTSMQGPAGSTSTQEIRYMRSYVDRMPRSLRHHFRGFREVQVTEAKETTRFLFAVGDSTAAGFIKEPYANEWWPDSPELAGRLVARIEVGPAQSRETWTRWRTLDTGVPGARRPAPETRRTYDVRLVGGSTQTRRREIRFSYAPAGPQFGNVVSIKNWGEVTSALADGTPTTDGDESELTIVYAQPTASDSYEYGLPRRIERRDGAGTVLRAIDLFYDGRADDGVDRGNVSKVRETVMAGANPPELVDWSYEYDTYGSVTRAEDPEGGVLEISYDDAPPGLPATSRFRVSKGKDVPVWLETRFFYDSLSRLTDVIDPNRRWVHYGRDSFGRVTEIRSSAPDSPRTSAIPGLLEETLVLEATIFGDEEIPNRITQRRYYGTGANDYHEERYFLDGFGRIVQMKQPFGSQWATVSRAFDPRARLTHESYPFLNASPGFEHVDITTAHPSVDTKVRAFDWAGRESTRFLRSSQQGSPEYYRLSAQFGLWTREVRNADPAVTGRKFAELDAYGRLVAVEEREGLTLKARTQFKYNALGNLIEYAAGTSNVAKLTYDSRGALRSVTDPDMANCAPPATCALVFNYDRNGRTIQIEESARGSVRVDLDELGRVYRRTHLPSSCATSDACLGAQTVASYSYDVGTNAVGRLSSATAGDVSLSFTYDNWGRALSEERSIGGVAYKTGFSYDLLGRLTRLAYPTGDTVTYEYNSAGPLGRVGWIGGPRTAHSRMVIEQIDYDVAKRPTKIRWESNSGITTSFAYNTQSGSDGRQQLQSIKVESSVVGAPFQALAYHYDNAARRTNVSDTKAGWSHAFQYDYAGRVARDDYAKDGVGTSTGFTYDAGGNLLKTFSPASATSPAEEYSYGSPFGGVAGPHALVSRVTYAQDGTASTTHSYRYDGSGNVTQIEGQAGTEYGFTYDAANRVTSVTHAGAGQPDSLEISYDPFGNVSTIVRRKVPDDGGPPRETRRFYGPHLELVTDSNETNWLERFVLIGGRRVAWVPDRRQGQFHVLHADALGSNVLSTNNDAAQGPEMAREYSTFGATQSISGEPSSRYGFIGAPDEIGAIIRLGRRHYDPVSRRMLQPDPIAPDLYNPQSLNRYTYAYNNPVSLADPLGLQAEGGEQGTLTNKTGPDGDVINTEPLPPTYITSSVPHSTYGGDPGQVTGSGTSPEPAGWDPEAPEHAGGGGEPPEWWLRETVDEEDFVDWDYWPKGYRYVEENVVGPRRVGITPTATMRTLESNPNAFFPFFVTPLSGPSTIREGQIYDLQWVRWPFDNGNFVRVESVTPTSFTFLTLDGHFDGPGATITFSAVERNGVVLLRQEGYAPTAGAFNSTFAPFGATSITWQYQAATLGAAMRSAAEGWHQ